MKKLLFIATLFISVAFAEDNVLPDENILTRCDVMYDDCLVKCEQDTTPDKCNETCDINYEACTVKIEQEGKKGEN